MTVKTTCKAPLIGLSLHCQSMFWVVRERLKRDKIPSPSSSGLPPLPPPSAWGSSGPRVRRPPSCLSVKMRPNVSLVLASRRYLRVVSPRSLTWSGLDQSTAAPWRTKEAEGEDQNSIDRGAAGFHRMETRRPSSCLYIPFYPARFSSLFNVLPPSIRSVFIVVSMCSPSGTRVGVSSRSTWPSARGRRRPDASGTPVQSFSEWDAWGHARSCHKTIVRGQAVCTGAHLVHDRLGIERTT